MLQFIYYEIVWIFRRLYKVLFAKKLRSLHYAGQIVLSDRAGNALLSNILQDNRIFMACRIGANEMRFIKENIEADFHFRKSLKQSTIYAIKNNAGFFASRLCQKDYKLFVDEYKSAINMADIVGVWYNPLEDYFIKKYGNSEYQLMPRSVYDFWEYEIPWTYALKDKRVLVVHPFSETIECQYAKREYLFENPLILPPFELITVKAVQTVGGGNNEDIKYENWFEALNAMYAQCMSESFDIALIAAGAYGLPLAAKLKQSGKSAIHMGGVLQVLFGIKGGRWDKHPTAALLYNEYWVRPSLDETPPESEKVENACYW